MFDEKKMKKISIIFFLFFFSQLVFAQIDFVPKENQFILSHKSETAFDLTQAEDKSKRWSPEYSDLKKVNKAILSFLSNDENNEKLSPFQKKEILKIIKQTKNYRVQYVGLVVAGEKRIWANLLMPFPHTPSHPCPCMQPSSAAVRNSGWMTSFLSSNREHDNPDEVLSRRGVYCRS